MDQNLFVYLLLCPISPVYSSLLSRRGPFGPKPFVYLLLCPISPVYSSLLSRRGPFGPKRFCLFASLFHLTCLIFSSYQKDLMDQTNLFSHCHVEYTFLYSDQDHLDQNLFVCLLLCPISPIYSSLSYQKRTIWTKTFLSVCFSVPSHLFNLLFLPEGPYGPD